MVNDILVILKLLLGINDDSKDDILELHIEMALQDVLNYTNRHSLPDALKHTVARKVKLTYEGVLYNKDYKAPVASVSERDSSISFASAQMTELEIIAEQKEITRQLNMFKLPFLLKPDEQENENGI